MTTYRGIKVTSDNVARDEKSPKAGIYRGTKHDAVKSEKSNTSGEGIYRGVKQVAYLLMA